MLDGENTTKQVGEEAGAEKDERLADMPMKSEELITDRERLLINQNI